jgi:hypothetical protein
MRRDEVEFSNETLLTETVKGRGEVEFFNATLWPETVLRRN